LATQVVHDEEELSIELFDRMDRGHIRMVQRGGEPGLGFSNVPVLGIRGSAAERNLRATSLAAGYLPRGKNSTWYRLI